MRATECRKSFTLIELLVVVAIIAILMAILLPALSRAWGSGHRTTCLSNLKQMAIAADMYAQEWNIYPISITGVGTRWQDFVNDPTLARTRNLGYAVSLYPYHKVKNLYDCPELVKLDCDISYSYNWLAGNDGVAYMGGRQNTLTRERIEMPDRFVFIYDQPIKTTPGPGMYHDIDPSDEWGGAEWEEDKKGVLWFYDSRPGAKGPHDGGHCILFGDGHARWFGDWEPRNMTRKPS
jgi:prepilin-type N-terminal cleavage/methylation domain-containing protein